MNKSILVLDENSVIHGLVTSALETEGLTLHHEFNPGRFVERANSLMPDLILIGNSERDPDYEICRNLQASGQLAEVPMVLLASSKQSLTRERLERLHVAGVVRKPFEASDLQQQVSKHLDLVDMIGSAYEYRQSQSTADDDANPLANLDVLDDEVLGLLRGGPAPVDLGEEPGLAFTAGAPVVDDDVLEEALQPERAFEPIEEAERPGDGGARFDSLETLEGEFPDQALEMPTPEAELDELGAADVLAEEAPEEAAFEPQGFDQELQGAGESAQTPLEEIEVELPGSAPEPRGAAEGLEEGEVELFEAELEQGGGEVEESIPLSVRRMMELKPVFSMTQEESVEAEEVLEPFDFEPGPGEVEAIQEDLGRMDEAELEPAVEMEPEPDEVHEQELEFASDQELQAIEAEAAPEAPAPGPEPLEAGLEPPEEFDLMVGPTEEPEAGLSPEQMMAEELPAQEYEAERLETEAIGEEVLADEELEAAEIGAEELEAVDLGAEEVEAEEVGAEALAAEEPPAPEPEPEAPPVTTAAEPAETEVVTPEAVAPAEGEVRDEEDYFVEEYLGDEEIDESQIIEAEEEELEQPELSEEDEAELEELLSEEERLDDLEELDDVEAESLVAEEEEGAMEDIELESEEEEAILSSIEAEREEAEGGAGETLFERNFNALDEERAASLEGEEAWELEEAEGGFSLAEEEGPGEVIDLGMPEPEPLEEVPLEEVPSSALEEVEPTSAEELAAEEPEAAAIEEELAPAEEMVAAAVEEELAAEEPAAVAIEEELAPAEEMVAEEPAAALAGEELAGEEEEVTLEFGEGETGLFGTEESVEAAFEEGEEQEGEVWKPKAPPGFVSRPGEDFPEDAVREPFTGPQGEPGSPEPPIEPRHTPDEELEYPDLLSREEGGEEAATRELVDEVQAHELEAETAEASEEEEFKAHPVLSALADDALSTVEPPAEPEPAEEAGFADLQAAQVGGEDLPEEEPWETAAESEDFEPVTLAAGTDTSADVTRGEVDALLAGEAAGVEAAVEETVAAESLGPPGGEAPVAASAGDAGFDDMFASLRDEIAANPEGERLDDVLRKERIRDQVAALDFSLPQHENTFARAMGVYALVDDDEGPSAYPAALAGSGAAAPQAAATAPSQLEVPVAPQPPPVAEVGTPAAAAPAGPGAYGMETLSLLDADIRAKLGQVLDEIISISVRKAVQEEMPKIMDRLSKEA